MVPTHFPDRRSSTGYQQVPVSINSIEPILSYEGDSAEEVEDTDTECVPLITLSSQACGMKFTDCCSLAVIVCISILVSSIVQFLFHYQTQHQYFLTTENSIEPCPTPAYQPLDHNTLVLTSMPPISFSDTWNPSTLPLPPNPLGYNYVSVRRLAVDPYAAAVDAGISAGHSTIAACYSDFIGTQDGVPVRRGDVLRPTKTNTYSRADTSSVEWRHECITPWKIDQSLFPLNIEQLVQKGVGKWYTGEEDARIFFDSCGRVLAIYGALNSEPGNNIWGQQLIDLRAILPDLPLAIHPQCEGKEYGGGDTRTTIGTDTSIRAHSSASADGGTTAHANSGAPAHTSTTTITSSSTSISANVGKYMTPVHAAADAKREHTEKNWIPLPLVGVGLLRVETPEMEKQSTHSSWTSTSTSPPARVPVPGIVSNNVPFARTTMPTPTRVATLYPYPHALPLAPTSMHTHAPFASPPAPTPTPLDTPTTAAATAATTTAAATTATGSTPAAVAGAATSPTVIVTAAAAADPSPSSSSSSTTTPTSPTALSTPTSTLNAPFLDALLFQTHVTPLRYHNSITRAEDVESVLERCFGGIPDHLPRGRKELHGAGNVVFFSLDDDAKLFLRETQSTKVDMKRKKGNNGQNGKSIPAKTKNKNQKKLEALDDPADSRENVAELEIIGADAYAIIVHRVRKKNGVPPIYQQTLVFFCLKTGKLLGIKPLQLLVPYDNFLYVPHIFFNEVPRHTYFNAPVSASSLSPSASSPVPAMLPSTLPTVLPSWGTLDSPLFLTVNADDKETYFQQIDLRRAFYSMYRCKEEMLWKKE